MTTNTNDEFVKKLMELAWSILWKKGSPFYLPDLILEGGTVNGKKVPAFNRRDIRSLGPVALFNKKPWGSVSVTFENASLDGLATISNKGFTFKPEDDTFSATVGFSNLTFAGDYALTGDGLAGCAIAGATGILGMFPLEAAGDSVDAVPYDDTHLELARSYRSKLVTSEGGLSLVSRYYDNNDAMNEIVRGDTFFTKIFPTEETDGKTSADFATQTTLAAQNPDSDAHTVGGTAYNNHAFAMQIAFTKSANDLYKKTGDTKYTTAATQSATFLNQTQKTGLAETPNKVSTIMDAVASSTPDDGAGEKETDSVAPQTDAQRAIEERITRAHEAWLAEGNESRSYSELLTASGAHLGTGSFNDSFDVPSFTFEGTAKVTGTVPDVKLTITLTKVSVDLPNINIQLQPLSNSKLYAEVVQAVAQSKFLHDLLRRRLNSALSGQDVLDYFSERINDAITKALSEP
ncbi:MAG: hypothetical protein AAGG47_10655 [Pseudomonadota bacterium]